MSTQVGIFMFMFGALVAVVVVACALELSHRIGRRERR